MRTHHTQLSRTALVAPLAALALAVSGCGMLDRGGEDPTDPPAAEEPAETAEQDPSDGGGTDPSDGGGEGTGDQGGTAAADVEVAPPGTELAVGESANVHVQVLDKGEEFYAFGVVETTVTEIVEGDPAIIEEFDEDDKADLQGMTPWYVKAEHEVLTFEGDDNADLTPVLTAQDAQGNMLTIAISFGGTLDTDCDPEFFDQLAVGATASTCGIVFTDGEPPAQVAWEGDSKVDGTGDENPYKEQPVVWKNKG